MKSKAQMNLQDALTKTLQKIQGSWGIIAFDKENPKSLIVSKNDQCFLIGLSPKSIYIASEVLILL